MTANPHSLPPHTPLLDRATERGYTLDELATHFRTDRETVAAWLVGAVPIPGENRAILDRLLDLQDLDDDAPDDPPTTA